MEVTKITKKEIMEKFALHSKDTGSPEVQIATFTERISNLTRHLSQFKKDYSSKRGLLKLITQRRKLLRYLKSEDEERYKKLMENIGDNKKGNVK